MVRCGTAIHKISAISVMFLITSVVSTACSPEQPSSASASPGVASPADVLPPSIASPAPAPSVASLPPLDDVPTYKGNAARTGVQPGPGPIAEPVLVWEAKIDCPVGERTPIIGDGLVYAGCAAPARASRRSIGPTGLESGTRGCPDRIAAYGDGAVYAADSGGSFHAFDAASGKERWHLDIKPRGSPVVVDGTVYVGSDDGRVYGLNQPMDRSPGRGRLRRARGALSSGTPPMSVAMTGCFGQSPWQTRANAGTCESYPGTRARRASTTVPSSWPGSRKAPIRMANCTRSTGRPARSGGRSEHRRACKLARRSSPTAWSMRRHSRMDSSPSTRRTVTSSGTLRLPESDIPAALAGDVI